MDSEEKKHNNDQNSGHPQTIINIHTAYNVNPAATEVKNTFIIGSSKETTAAIKEAVGLQPKVEKPESIFDRMKEPEEEVDCGAIRIEILNYVSRVSRLVVADKRDRYMRMWKGILELNAVKPYVYKTGKQKETNFNRSLIARILHHLDTRHMYTEPYKASEFAEALEGSYDKSVRGELGKFPSDYMCTEINKFLETLNL